MKRVLFLTLLPVIFWYCVRLPKNDSKDSKAPPALRIMFWNAENLFDCQKDSISSDEEFLPYGIRGWNSSRYQRKIGNMYKVFIAAGDWEPPDLIGLCEIENKNVIFGLLRDTPFSYYNYRFVHHDSPDRRGIDVALLYNPASVEVISETFIPVRLSKDPDSKTRDILKAEIKSKTGDTLMIFVNHWPSKYGGAGYTADLRKTVAKILADSIYKVLKVDPLKKIIVMGDFNDPPESSSMDDLCRKSYRFGTIEKPLLVNLSEVYSGTINGSYKFEGSWSLIDQVLVSESLTSNGNNEHVLRSVFRVFSPGFLMEKDEKYGGTKPFRTYAGMVYQGGYSDHLPVILDLFEPH